MSSLPPPFPFFVFRSDTNDIHSLLFCRLSGKDTLYAGSSDGTVYIYDLTTNKKVSSFRTSDSACLFLHFVDDLLLTQDKNCCLRVWNASIYSHCCIYEKNFNNLSFCKINVIRNKLAVPQPNSVIEIHEYVSSSTSLVARLLYPDESIKLGEVLQLKLFDHNRRLFTAAVYENGNLTIWNVENSSIFSSIQITNHTPMAFDLDAEKLQGVCGTNEKTITFFRMDEQLQLIKKKEVEITNAGVGCLRIRFDRKILAAGCWDGKVRIFSWKTCKLLAALDCHRTSVLEVAFASEYESQVLAATASDKKISLWNIYD